MKKVDWIEKISWLNKKTNSNKINIVWDFSILIENIIILEKENNKEKLYKHEKEELLKELSNNHPAFEIYENLEHWDNFLEIIFTWIKFLNDIYGQQFTDKILNEIKAKILNEFNTIFSTNILVWNDYKNYVIKNNEINNDDIKYFNEIFKILLYDIYSKNIDLENNSKKSEKLKKISKENFKLWIKLWIWKIENIKWFSTEQNIALSLAKTRIQLEKEFMWLKYWYLDFNNFWYKKIFNEELEKNNDEKIYIKTERNWKKIEKNYIVKDGNFSICTKYIDTEIESIIKINIIDKNWNLNDKIFNLYLKWKIPKELKLYEIITKTYYTKNIKNIAEEKVFNEKENIEYEVNNEHYIEREYESNKIKYENKIQIFNKRTWFINDILITKARKNELPEWLALTQKIKNIIKLLIVDWEFIFPEWKNRWNIEEYKKIKEFIKNWTNLKEINKYLDKYYKWYLSQKAFNKIVENKEWQLYFIDIKDMWTINIIWFFQELEKIKNNKNTHNEAILNSWSSMTNKFKNYLKNIEKELNWKNFYLTIWWDEVKIFIEKNNDHKNISDLIHKQLDKEEIFCRITTRAKSKKEKLILLDEELDKKTSSSKKLEKLFQILENRRIEISRMFFKQKKDIQDILSNINFDSNESDNILEKINNSIKSKIEENDKKLSTINSFKHMYIYLEKQWKKINNWERDILLNEDKYILSIWNNIFILDNIIDGNWNFIENSDFLKFLDKNWIWREQ